MQHREWNPKTFFKKLSPDVITLYEQKYDIKLKRDCGRPVADQTYFAWKLLPEDQRKALETELLPVNDMCTTHARPYLDQLAKTVWVNGDAHLIEKSRDWSVYDLAMRLFIQSPQKLLDAHRNYAVDMMSHFKEFRGKYKVHLEASEYTKSQMRKEMLKHFRQQAGGAQCQVEDFEGEDKFAIFIYHEDEMTPIDRFDNTGIVVAEWQRPVTKIAAVFYPDTSTLLVKAPRKPEREKLRELFAEIFVGETDYFEDLNRNPKFNFEPLTHEDFDFPTHAADCLDDVCITRVTLRTAHADIRRVSIDFVRNLSLSEVHDALAEHGLFFDGKLIEGVRLQFTFDNSTGRARFRTVSLYNPNNSNLRDTHRDRVIRRYLREWGLDERRSSFAMAVPAVQAAASF